jgi:hypothetical protein
LTSFFYQNPKLNFSHPGKNMFKKVQGLRLTHPGTPWDGVFEFGFNWKSSLEKLIGKAQLGQLVCVLTN